MRADSVGGQCVTDGVDSTYGFVPGEGLGGGEWAAEDRTGEVVEEVMRVRDEWRRCALVCPAPGEDHALALVEAR